MFVMFLVKSRKDRIVQLGRHLSMLCLCGAIQALKAPQVQKIVPSRAFGTISEPETRSLFGAEQKKEDNYSEILDFQDRTMQWKYNTSPLKKKFVEQIIRKLKSNNV